MEALYSKVKGVVYTELNSMIVARYDAITQKDVGAAVGMKHRIAMAGQLLERARKRLVDPDGRRLFKEGSKARKRNSNTTSGWDLQF